MGFSRNPVGTPATREGTDPAAMMIEVGGGGTPPVFGQDSGPPIRQ